MGGTQSTKSGGALTISKRKTGPRLSGRGLPEINAGKAKTYKRNEIREIVVSENFSVLVSEFDGKFYAYGSKCPHNGANLHSGVLVDGMIRCPWHGACFDIRTGDIEDHPGMDCIPTYRTERGKRGIIKIYPEHEGIYKVQRPLGTMKDPNKVMLILGGGAAGLIFAQTLRELNYEGRILMISKDSHLPYDRTKLSKIPGMHWNELKLREEKWYAKAEVEIMLNATVIWVNLNKKLVFLDGSESKPLGYDQLLIATGLRPRIPIRGKNGDPAQSGGVDGANLRNVMTLYSLKDSAKIKEKTKGRRIVIMGSGFIAMELVTSLHAQCEFITVLSRTKRPYGAVLGEFVGKIIQERIIGKYENFKFLGREDIKQIIGDSEKKVKQVITMKGVEIDCSVVIYAIGGVPNTDFLLPLLHDSLGFGKVSKGPSLGMTLSGHIPVNEYMETSIKDVWVAGDVARIPLNSAVSQFVSVGHWGMAQKMGRLAALSVMGIKQSIINAIPFYWTVVGGVSLRYVGYGEHYNNSAVFVDLNELRFCIVYRRETKIIAVCTANCDPIAAKIAFDLEDEVDWGLDYPDYIADSFTDPPIIGDALEGIKFNEQEDFVIDFDAHAIQIKDLWVERHQKIFNNKLQYREVEYKVNIQKAISDQQDLAFKKDFNESNKPGMQKHAMNHNRMAQQRQIVKYKKEFLSGSSLPGGSQGVVPAEDIAPTTLAAAMIEKKNELAEAKARKSLDNRLIIQHKKKTLNNQFVDFKKQLRMTLPDVSESILSNDTTTNDQNVNK